MSIIQGGSFVLGFENPKKPEKKNLKKIEKA